MPDKKCNKRFLGERGGGGRVERGEG